MHPSGASRLPGLACLAAFAATVLLGAAAAPGQTKIGKVKSLNSIVQTADGRLLVFCGLEGYRADTVHASTDATGKTWNKPVRLARFGAAIAGPDNVVYIVSHDGKKYKTTDRELVVSDTQTAKGGMAAPPAIAPGKPLPVAYVDDGKLYVTLLETK